MDEAKDISAKSKKSESERLQLLTNVNNLVGFRSV